MPFTKQQKLEFKECISDFFADPTFVNSLAEKVADIVVNKIDERLAHLEKQVALLVNKTDELEAKNEQLKIMFDDIEQKTKQNQLRFYGIPESPNENLKEKLENIFSKVFKINGCSLDYCYRIGQRDQENTGSRAALVQFSSVMQRNLVYFSKKKLKGTKIVVAEELTKGRHNLLMMAKKNFTKGDVWTKFGNIFVKIDNKRYQIKNNMDLSKLIGKND